MLFILREREQRTFILRERALRLSFILRERELRLSFIPRERAEIVHTQGERAQIANLSLSND